MQQRTDSLCRTLQAIEAANLCGAHRFAVLLVIGGPATNTQLTHIVSDTHLHPLPRQWSVLD